MKIREGFDLVSGWKRDRNDPLSKTVPSKLFNLTTRLFSGIPLHDFNCGLRAARRSALLGLGLEAPGMELASEMIVLAAQAPADPPLSCITDGTRVRHTYLRHADPDKLRSYLLRVAMIEGIRRSNSIT